MEIQPYDQMLSIWLSELSLWWHITMLNKNKECQNPALLMYFDFNRMVVRFVGCRINWSFNRLVVRSLVVQSLVVWSVGCSICWLVFRSFGCPISWLYDRLVVSISWSFYQLLVLSIARSIGCLFYRLLVLLVVRSIGCSFYQLLVLLVGRSIGCSFYRLLIISVARSIDWSFYRLFVLSLVRPIGYRSIGCISTAEQSPPPGPAQLKDVHPYTKQGSKNSAHTLTHRALPEKIGQHAGEDMWPTRCHYAGYF